MKPRGRVSLFDQKRANALAMRAMAISSPKELTQEAIDLATPVERKERVKRAARQSTEQSEADVQADVIKWLQANPSICGLKRINRGQAMEGSRRIEYCHVYGKHDGEYMTALDLEFWLSLPGGTEPHTIPCEIELKKPSWKAPSMNNRTERMQWVRIKYVRAHGGIAGYARSVAEVQALLENA